MCAIAGGNGMARVGCEAVGGQVKSHRTGHGTVGVDTPHATVGVRIVVTHGKSGFTKRSAMSGDGSLIKIGALFFAAVIFTAVPNSKATYAQNGRVGNFGHSHGSFHGRSGFVQNRGVRNFERFRGSFDGGPRFRGRFDHAQRGFGSTIVIVPSVGAPPEGPYYDAPPPGYDSLKCFLHRHVETPHGWVLEPVYVC
jgi:hypothetical protein